MVSKPFSEGEFVKICQMKATEIVCPEKHQAFADISLRKHSWWQDFWSFSRFWQPVQAQSEVIYCVFNYNWWKHGHYKCCTLAIFICGVDDTLTMTEEFLAAAADIFMALVSVLDRVGVNWSRVVSLATDCTPSLIGGKASDVTKFREKVQSTNNGHDFCIFYCMLQQEALCCNH